MRALVVRALVRACDATHATGLDRLDPTGRLLGCRLAALSDALDQRWGTGVWTSPTS